MGNLAKYPIGTPVYFFTMVDKVPGVVEDVQQDERGNWVYKIRISYRMVAKNVAEHSVTIRTIVEPPKYERGTQVAFKSGKGEQLVGKIEIVDPYGTFEQDEEPSYDIMVEGEPRCLYKHIRESCVIGVVVNGKN